MAMFWKSVLDLYSRGGTTPIRQDSGPYGRILNRKSLWSLYMGTALGLEYRNISTALIDDSMDNGRPIDLKDSLKCGQWALNWEQGKVRDAAEFARILDVIGSDISDAIASFNKLALVRFGERCKFETIIHPDPKIPNKYTRTYSRDGHEVILSPFDKMAFEYCLCEEIKPADRVRQCVEVLFHTLTYQSVPALYVNLIDQICAENDHQGIAKQIFVVINTFNAKSKPIVK